MPLPMPSALVPVIDTQKFDNPLAGLLQAMQAMRTLGGGIRGKAGSGMSASMAKLGLGGELRRDRWGNVWVNDGENAEDKIAKRKAHELEVTRDLVMDKGAEALNLLKNGYVNPETGEAVPWEALDLGRRQQQVENWEATVVPKLSQDLKLDPEQVKEVFTAPVRKENEALAKSIAGSSGFMDNLLSGGAGALDSLLTGARGLFSSPEEKIRNAEALQAREQARIAASPFLQNQAKREALGDVARLSGPGSSIAGSLGATLGENAPGLATMMLPGWGVGRLAGMVVPRLGATAANVARFGVPLAQMGANGVMGGWLADQQLAQDIAATPGLTEAQKAQAYDQGDTMAGLAGFAGGAMMGALPGIRGMFPGATGNVVGRAILGGEAPGVIRSALTTGLEGAMGMGTQQAGVNAARNAGVEQFGVAPRDVMEGVGEAALGGALTGAGLSVATRAGRAMFGKGKSLVTRKSNNKPPEASSAENAAENTGNRLSGDPLDVEGFDNNGNQVDTDAASQQSSTASRPAAESTATEAPVTEVKAEQTDGVPVPKPYDPKELKKVVSKYNQMFKEDGVNEDAIVEEILLREGVSSDVLNKVSQVKDWGKLTPDQQEIVKRGVERYAAGIQKLKESGEYSKYEGRKLEQGEASALVESFRPAAEGAPGANPGETFDQSVNTGPNPENPAAQSAGATGPVNGRTAEPGNSGESSSQQPTNTVSGQSTQDQGLGSPTAGNGQPTGQPAPGAGPAANQGAGGEARQTAGSGTNESTAGNAGGGAKNGGRIDVSPGLDRSIREAADNYRTYGDPDLMKEELALTMQGLYQNGYTSKEIPSIMKDRGWTAGGIKEAKALMKKYEARYKTQKEREEAAIDLHNLLVCMG